MKAALGAASPEKELLAGLAAGLGGCGCPERVLAAGEGAASGRLPLRQPQERLGGCSGCLLGGRAGNLPRCGAKPAERCQRKRLGQREVETLQPLNLAQGKLGWQWESGAGGDPDATSGALPGCWAACPPRQHLPVLAHHLDGSSQQAGKAASTSKMLPLFLRGVLAEGGCDACLFLPTSPVQAGAKRGVARSPRTARSHSPSTAPWPSGLSHPCRRPPCGCLAGCRLLWAASA